MTQTPSGRNAAQPADPGAAYKPSPAERRRREAIMTRTTRARAAAAKASAADSATAATARNALRRAIPIEAIGNTREAEGASRTLPRGRRDERAPLSRRRGGPGRVTE